MSIRSDVYSSMVGGMSATAEQPTREDSVRAKIEELRQARLAIGIFHEPLVWRKVGGG